MSLYVLRCKTKNCSGLHIETLFQNWFYRDSYIEIGESSDSAGYRFSLFDQECNCFKFKGNIFTGDIRIKLKQRPRCRLFGTNHNIKGKADVVIKNRSPFHFYF